ncbi:MAG: magnesium/cobalt transporter CorA [Gammaproteobacteria bacterium]|nr:magnesium/cobalt transporter CorA [Gammaproteobacteria bacterium]MDH5801482.1 magnesium/cobalt transporter CorA [Gammaproteobacteria bacterium]
MDYFDKTYHPPGTSPGTLTSAAPLPGTNPCIRLVDYNAVDYIDKELSSLQECKDYIDTQSITWVHLQNITQAEIIQDLGTLFDLHALALEDVLNTGQRPKVEEYDELLFVVLSLPQIVEHKLTTQQVSLFMGSNLVITAHNGESDPFEPLRQRLRKKKGRTRQQQADYLGYSIIDLIVDQGYPVLDALGETIETLEEEILSLKSKNITLTQIHQLRRELLILRRNLWPQREIVNQLLRSENGFFEESTRVYLRDCYDHTAQILDIIENYRETAGGLIDIYLSSASHRLSEIMRVLTMIATIFIPLTFVVGLYGMNFNNPNSPWSMPELRWYYGYPMVWLIMAVLVTGMLIYFKRKNWL